MDEIKKLKIDIRKCIDKSVKICKSVPDTDINKTLEKLNDNVAKINIEELDLISTDKNLLQLEYKKCLAIKKDTDKIFQKIKEHQLNLTDKNQKLDTLKKEMTNYMSQINSGLKNDSGTTWSEILILLEQNIQVIEHWQKNDENLSNKLKTGFDVAVNIFNNYINKITQLQRKLYE